MTLLQPMMVAALFMGGVTVALLGSIKVPLARSLRIDETRIGGLISIFGFMMMPVILGAGFLTDHFGKFAVLSGGSILLAASLFVLAISTSYIHAFLAVIIMSAGWSLLINVGNVLTPTAFPGTMAHATNLANVFFGLGAFLTPLLVTALVRNASLRVALVLLGVLALVPAMLALGVDFNTIGPAREVNSTAVEAGFGAVLGDPLMWLCGLALFFYGPLEASMGAWTTTYLGNKGVSETAAAGALSAFWLTYLAARLVAAYTLPQGQEALSVLVLALLSTVILAAMVISRSRISAIELVVAAGMTFGPIFPTIMAILLGHFPSNLHGRAVGMLFAIGGIGWTIIPILMGAYAQRTSVQRSFVVAALASTALCLVGLALVLR